jgi:hypothetical protein
VLVDACADTEFAVVVTVVVADAVEVVLADAGAA